MNTNEPPTSEGVVSGGGGPPGSRQFPCKGCGAKLVFAPGHDSLTCQFCGAMNEIAVKQEAIEELDYASALAEVASTQETEDRIIVHCGSCGADVPMKANVTSQACQFCGTPIVATGETKKLIRPRSLLPFKIADKQAREMFAGWLKGLWFAPNNLKKAAVVEGRLTGCYVPYWTYDAHAETAYTGQRGDDYWVTETYSTTENGRSVTRTRQVRRTRWTAVSGDVRNVFDDVLVPASTSLPREKLAKLDEWDLPALVPYADEYLSGFMAESYTVDLPTGFGHAQEVMVEVIKGTIRGDIGGDHQVIDSMSPVYDRVTFKHILLPIWIAAYRYHGKVYRFIVNARSGQVAGDRPYSWIKITLFVMMCVVIAAVVIGLIVMNQR